jgi:pimeloyl-ACP methyl ester carboxylesterase
MMKTIVIAALTLFGATAALAETPRLAGEEFLVPSDPGTHIYVRNKRSADMAAFRPERTVVFVHGATNPASTGFDLALGGLSWMDYIAARGYDVYLLDLRGYGRSTRPKEMEEDAAKNPPLVRGETALRDIGAVVDFVRKRRNLLRVVLIGHSWGTTLMATYTTQHPDKVERLVLYAPQWLRTTPSAVVAQAGSGALGAYRLVTVAQTRARRMAGVPADKQADLFPPGWFDAWIEATWAADPTAASRNPPAIRAPNGTAQDTLEFWSAGKPYYDPAKISVPTLLVLGEWDNDTPPAMAQTLFPLLVNAPGKRLVVLGEGTHVIYMERNRLKLFEAVQGFLDEAGPSSPVLLRQREAHDRGGTAPIDHGSFQALPSRPCVPSASKSSRTSSANMSGSPRAGKPCW